MSFEILSDTILPCQGKDAGNQVGVTGSPGKTSIVNLTQRFYDVTNGEVLLDGIDIRAAALVPFKSQTTVVMQGCILSLSLPSRHILRLETGRNRVGEREEGPSARRPARFHCESGRKVRYRDWRAGCRTFFGGWEAERISTLWRRKENAA